MARDSNNPTLARTLNFHAHTCILACSSRNLRHLVLSTTSPNTTQHRNHAWCQRSRCRGTALSVMRQHRTPTDSARQAGKFIEAYAAFLKRQGKLPIPGPSPTTTSMPT